MLLLTRIDSAEDAVSIDTMQLLRSVGNVWVTVNASSSILQQVNSKGSSFLDGRWVSLPLSSVSLSLGEAVDQLVVLLDKGASRVVLPASAPWLGEMLADPLLPPSRLAVHIIDASTSAAVAGLVAVAGGDRGAEIAIIVSINDGGGIAVFDEVLAAGMSQVWVDAAVDTTPLTYDFIKSIKSKGASTVIPWKSINMSNNKSSSSLLDLGRIVCECHLTTDRSDGLFTTIVKDEHGVALGLVYSSVESVSESIRLQQGVYQSRKKIGKELWYKGKTSGATQKLIQIDADCDGDCLSFTVNQTPPGFCHLGSRTCWGADSGITALASVLEHRKTSAPVGSYTARLFNDPALLRSKILEEANELVDAVNPDEIAWETADLIYFALTKCVANGVSLKQVEDHLDQRSRKVTRRPGNAKPAYMNGSITPTMTATSTTSTTSQPPTVPKPQLLSAKDDKLIRMSVYNMKKVDPATLTRLTHRPIMKTDEIMDRVQPILKSVRLHGDKAIRELTSKFDRIDFDESTSVVIKAPFPASMTASIPGKVKEAIDLAFENIRKFHAAQLPVDQDQVASVLRVETMPGVFCSRFVRPIENVGLYIPGGSAVLPSTALMLGVPAMVAGCKQIVFATPPRRNDTDICPVCPEVVYVAEKVGASMILMAGGAQAVAAMAYGTESVPKVDKICGPGNQYVTAAKMVVQNDSSALVSIDMPAGPSEVLVIADDNCTPEYVVSDLLSQAEHGPDSQVILLSVNLSPERLEQIQIQVGLQAKALPRYDIIQQSIAHSHIIECSSRGEAMFFSNSYAPEHLILHVDDELSWLPLVENAGSVFLGKWAPESCGDYASGTNHTLPTYGYAKMYSGVNTNTFVKHITAQHLTKQGLANIGGAVMNLAEVEGLDAHRNAVAIRLKDL